MLRLGQKIQIFIFGMSVGIIASGLFFVFKLDHYFTQMQFGQTEKQKTIIEEVVQTRTEPAPSPKTPATANSKPAPTKETTPNATSAGIQPFEEDYKVLKDELIGVKNLYLRDLDGQKQHPTDSVLSAQSGITESKNTAFFMLEFWKTPLNSKGYKMTKNRILLYGISEGQEVSLLKFKDKYYLKNATDIYFMSFSADFRPLEKIQDEAISSKFN